MKRKEYLIIKKGKTTIHRYSNRLLTHWSRLAFYTSSETLLICIVGEISVSRFPIRKMLLHRSTGALNVLCCSVQPRTSGRPKAYQRVYGQEDQTGRASCRGETIGTDWTMKWRRRAKEKVKDHTHTHIYIFIKRETWGAAERLSQSRVGSRCIFLVRTW